MIENLASVSLFIIASFGLFAVGRPLLSFAKISLTPGERLAWGYLLGSLVISVALTILGFAGLYIKPAGFAVLILSLAAAIYKPKGLREDINGLYRSLRRLTGRAKKPEYAAAFIIIAILGGAFALVALAPEVRYDALQYHLELPKRYINAGRITFQHDILQSAFPQAWGMLYGYGLLLSGTEQVPKLFAFAAGVCALAAAYSAGRRFFGKSAGVFATVVLVTTSMFAEYWSNSMADIPFTLFLTVGALALVYGRKRIYRASVIAGLFLGFAAATRMQALVLAPVILVIYACVVVSVKPGLKRGIAALVITYGIATAFAVPWYVHNHIATGSITGYFVSDVSRYEEWRTAASADSFVGRVIQFFAAENFRGPRGPWYTKLLLPFLLTFKPNLWGQGVVGPLYLALLPGIFFARKRLTRVLFLVAIVGVAIVAWVFLLKEINVRYLMPATLTAAIASGYAWSVFFRSGIIGKLAGWFVLAFAVGTSLFFVYHVSEYFPYGPGLKDRDKFVTERIFRGFDAVGAVNSLPEGSLVFTNDGRTFYFDTPVVMGRPEHNLYFNTMEIQDPNEMLEWFTSHEVTHVLAVSWESDFTFPGKPFRNPDGEYHFRDDFLDVYGVVLAEGGHEGVKGGYYTLYEMRYR
ncbi:MAG: glycosyltransferase family 39 protein [Candidatus Coatesbacteria bacterium]|nr:MAG: glycosyltransferase family 39 protein [Candidatus Coatesbacteria bacterium]